MTQSIPPQGGPSFNQILVIVLIAAIIVLGALLIFDPQVRHHGGVDKRVDPRGPSNGLDGPPN